MTRYNKGAAFERKVRDDLRARGFIAERIAGSHSPADIHAFKGGAVYFIQCKTNGVLSPTEWNAFFDYCEDAGATPILAQKLTRGIGYHVLTAKKEKRGKQPMEEWGLLSGRE